MKIINSFWATAFVILLLSSLIVFDCPCYVQAAPKTSVPQFNIKFVDNSYDVPSSTTTTVDQYTGQEITNTKPGYHVDNRTIEVTIKNQPFTPYTDTNGIEFNLYFRVEVKGHFGEDWQAFGSGYIAQSSSDYTVVSCTVKYAAGAQLDFRVIAVIAELGDAIADTGSLAYFLYGITSPYIKSEVSCSTSGVQTFTMPGGSPSASSAPITTLPTSPSTTPNNNQPLQNQTIQDQPQLPNFMAQPIFLLIIGILFVSVVITAVMAFLKRHLKTSDFSNTFS
jgi:hypothetical protein